MQILQITPFMHVNEAAFEAALGFWQAMGFRIILNHQPTYAYLEREGAGLRLQGHDNPAEIAPGTRGFRYYVDVRDVDAIHHELKPILDAMPEGHVYGPIDQPYGQRELLILAPDGDLLVVGAARGKAGG